MWAFFLKPSIWVRNYAGLDSCTDVLACQDGGLQLVDQHNHRLQQDRRALQEQQIPQHHQDLNEEECT